MTLPSTISLIKKYDLFAKKSLGQNFITDENLTDKIVGLAGDISDSTIIEVGPGPGCLTRSILKLGAKKLYSIEKDERFYPLLEEISASYDNRLEVIAEDALKMEMKVLADEITIIANLPYNISTVLLIKWLKQPKLIKRMVLMFQKEVADKIVAQPNNKIYGRLSVMAQALSKVSYGFTVQPTAFSPPPKVKSAIVVFQRRDTQDLDISRLEFICKAAFSQRRKTIKTNLKPVFDNLEESLQKLNIDPKLRPENLSVDDFIALAKIS